MPYCFRNSLAALVMAGAWGQACVSSRGDRDAMAASRPMMPTIRPAPAVRTAIPAAQIVAAALQHARRSDNSAAIQTLNEADDSGLRTDLAVQVASRLAEEDLLAAGAFAEALPFTAGRLPAIDTVAEAWVRRDPEEGLRWAGGLTEWMAASNARRVAVDYLVRENPRAAMERLDRLPPGAVRDDLLTVAAGAYARHDSTGAEEWLRGRPDGDLKQRLTSTVGFELAQKTPARAIALAETLPEGRNRWLLLGAIAQTWVAVDAKAAMAWARQLPAGEPRDAAFAGVDTGLGVPRARRAASAPGTRTGVSRTRAGAPIPDVESMSPAFAAWLSTQRPGMSREEAILEYVRQRGALEPHAIGPWLSSLPSSPVRDRAMDVYLDGLVATSPAEAARWVRSLPRSERTDDLIEKTARQYLIANPDAAELWLRSSTLPPDRQERLLQQFRP